MRIVILADLLLMGGLETHIVAFSNELLRRGHQLFLYTAYTKPDLISLINRNNRSFFHGCWSDDPVNDLNSFQPEIIHAHPFTAIFKGFDLAVALSKPFFVTMHGLYDFGLDRSIQGNLISERVQKIIAVDNGVAGILKSSTAHPEKVVVIPNGIDLDFFSPRPLKKVGSGRYTLTVISRFDDGKERPIRSLLQCVENLSCLVKGLDLIIVGDGSRASELRSLAAQLDRAVSNLTVHFTGPQNDVRGYIARADLCLACDRAALEAMACYRPVFAMNSYGFAGPIDNSNFREVLLNRRGYRELHPAELVERLAVLLKDQAHRRLLAEEGLEIIKQNFNIADSVSQLEAVYSQVEPVHRKARYGGKLK